MKHFKLVIAGAGTGGCSIANRFTRSLGAGNVAVVDNAEKHYYQPMWTLVGGGAKTFEQSQRLTKDLLPSKAEWIKDRVSKFDPKENAIVTEKGDKITYDFLVVALGIKLNYDQVKGLPGGFSKDAQICSNYSPTTVLKTFPAFQNFPATGGKAIFTFPNTPVKCAGAPQKIMYLFEDFLRKNKKRDASEVHYYTSLGVLFGIKKYAAVLTKICAERGINIHLRHNLIEVLPESRQAIFEHLDTKEKVVVPYNLLHVTPPMGPVDCLKGSPLVDPAGFVSVNKESLQHTEFPNVFALGDCSNAPTAKTAAGVSSQSSVVSKNLSSVMSGGKPSKAIYDGYTSCPLVTGYDRCVLAEFDYNGEPLETMPLDQGKERWLSYMMKAHLMPQLYWHGLVKGFWNGPKIVRKMLHLGTGK